MTKPCPEHELALQAMLDDELDALSAAALEDHLHGCIGCRQAYAELERLQHMLRSADWRIKAPAALHASMEALGNVPTRPKPAPKHTAVLPWLGGGAVGALAASLAILIAIPQVTEPGIADEVVGGQIRSLQTGHLVDVETSDRHTVKPWFNGRIDYSPPVVDLAARGFPLVGGRLDVLGDRTVAVLVYKRRLHTINLYVRPVPTQAIPVESSMERRSYAIVRWTTGGLEYWAVSDIPAEELRRFGTAFRAETQG